MSNINAAIEHLARPVSGLTHYDGNARRHDLQTIAASLKANGQYRPIVVRRHPTDPNRDDVVLAGNGTLAAARDLLQWTEIAATYVECDDRTAKRVVLVDNRANELGGYDEQALAALLSDLQGDFDGTGYEQEDLDDLLDSLAPPSGEGEGGTGMGEPVVRYEVVFDTEEQQSRFYRHLRTLRDKYPDEDSIAQRLVLHFDATLETPTD